MRPSRLVITILLLLLGALSATTAQAQKYGTFIIDDFYTEPPPQPPIGAVTKFVTDTSAGNGAEVAPSDFPASVPFLLPAGNNVGTGFPPDISTVPIGNIVMNVNGGPGNVASPDNQGWRRGLSADLISGDDITTRVCGNCGTGESNRGSASTGVSQWIYTDNGTGSVDFGANVVAGSPLYFEYSSDLDGAVVEFSFADSTGAGSIGSVSTAPLPNTGGALPTNLTLQTLGLPVGPDYSDITDVLIEVSGPVNLDFQIDNVEVGAPAVPEPSAFALSLLGLLGVGLCSWRRRRR